MNAAAREEYLTTEVMTAAPQKLQLMLLDAAILLVTRAQRHWAEGRNEAAFDTLLHAQRIVTQLINGLTPNLDAPLVRQMAAVYGFIYRTLVLATANHDEQKLSDALRVLEVERETWRQVCDKLGTRRLDDQQTIPAPVFTDAMADAPISLLESSGGFSLEV